MKSRRLWDLINIISSAYLDSWRNESDRQNLAEKPANFAGCRLLHTTLDQILAFSLCCCLWKLQWVTKVLRHLAVTFDFLRLGNISPHFSQNNVDFFFYFFKCTDHSTYTTLNWGARGIRELMLDANKIEQMLKYRKSSFPKSVSTTFVAHCSATAIRRASSL